MNAKCSLKTKATIESYTEKQTKCFVCNKSVFKVARIKPELIMMKCSNCGEIHMVGAKSADEAAALTFWDADEGPLI
jgi:translation initiation factor 2 beta subunit (eIF-2beta)/eIF-5